MKAVVLALATRVRRATSHVAFFELVHLLEGLLSRQVSIGSDESADRETVHFTHEPLFDFPVGDATDLVVKPAAESLQATIRSTSLGLIGAESPLIPAVSEAVLLDSDEGHLQAFFDVFHHRAVALLYRTWKRYSPVAGFESASRGSFERALVSMVGVDPFGGQASSAAHQPRFVLGLSDYVRCDPTFLDAAALEAIVRRVFPDLNARLGQGDPTFVAFALGEQTRLGEARSILGVNAVYGAGATDLVGTLRLTVGPVDERQSGLLLPGGGLYQELFALCDQWLYGRVDVELEVILPRALAPTVSLSGQTGARLGEDTCVIADDASIVRLRVPLVPEGQPADRSYYDH